ncbi:FMN-binding protein [Anaerolentibacter hominis]|uniref:FMN-binding protein n=1 Tax=Anaerolentibacter hominis TaxID=3079009 RepID=UPI0031B89289
MSIIAGYFSLICFVLLLIKSFTRKFRWDKPDEILERLHKPLSATLLVSSVFHVIFAIPVFHTRSILVIVTGLGLVLLLVLIILLGHGRRDDRAKWLRRHRILAGLLLLMAIVHMVTYMTDFQDYQTRVGSITLHGIDTSGMPDGEYTGEYDAGYIYAKVRVIISEGRIETIHLLEHENERGQAAESVIADILDTQTFPVDAVSGATNSSKVIQMAVQNALEETAVKE